jgi:hypothetical protein
VYCFRKSDISFPSIFLSYYAQNILGLLNLCFPLLSWSLRYICTYTSLRKHSPQFFGGVRVANLFSVCVVLLRVLKVWVLCCDVCYHFHIKKIFCSSFPPGCTIQRNWLHRVHKTQDKTRREFRNIWNINCFLSCGMK